MCIYSGLLGSGPVLEVQALTAIAIGASIAFWVWAYRRVGVSLRPYAIPIILWIVFGTLDILMTARGAFGNPYREGNPLARFIFVQSGYAGPVVASVLWIALWAGIVLAINKKFGSGGEKRGTGARMPLEFVSLAIFYSVATGHLFGFSSWFLPFCGIAGAFAPFRNLAGVILLGSALAALHLGAKGFWDKFL